MSAHDEWALAAKVAQPCTPAHIGFGGTCRNCGFPTADRRRGPQLTVEQILDKLAAAGVEITVNGRPAV